MSDQPDISPELEEKLSEQEILRQALEEARKKAQTYYDQLLRLKAEFENYRKRMEREKAEARAWGKQEVLLELINLVDVFEQALAQAHGAKDLKQVVHGVEMLHKSFTGFLKAEGLELLDVIGKPLDPHLAEAVEQTEVEDGQVGQVLAELQKGYTFQGRVLRPSRVRVGVAKKTETNSHS